MTVVSTSNPIDIPTFTQIATIVSELVTDYGNMAQTYFDMFYNTTPMDVSLTLYDVDGSVKTYVVPNRAKDRNYCRNGQGTPEGRISAPIGTIYQDTLNGVLYIKRTGTDSYGWSNINPDDVIEVGYESPEGRLVRPKGNLFIDANTASLYIKSTSTGATGWILISANTEVLADTDLSNLTTIGNNRFANRALGNLDPEGEAKFIKSNLSNVPATSWSTITAKAYPSSTYYDITWGSASITAVNSGWLYMAVAPASTATIAGYQLKHSSGFTTILTVNSYNMNRDCLIPVGAGDSVDITYTNPSATLTTATLRFLYAKGDIPETPSSGVIVNQEHVIP